MFLFEQITFEKIAIGNFYLLELFTAIGSDPKCQACKDAAATVEDMAGRSLSLGKIQEALTKFCPVISITDPKKCKAKAEEVALKMIKLISDDASPHMICQALGICKVKG